MQACFSRGLGVLAAAILLLGQGAALHHQHEIAADCPPGACTTHGSHPDAARADTVDTADLDGADGHASSHASTHELGARGDAVSSADHCPYCELLGQGRSSAPPAATTVAAAHGARARLAPTSPAGVAAPAGDVARARAPPRLA